MKLIIEQYSKIIIAIVVAAGVFVAFFQTTYDGQRGVSNILGGVAEDILHIQRGKTGAEFDQYMGMTLPRISVKNLNRIKAGQMIRIGECFRATDQDGRNVRVQVVAGWNEEGEPLATVAFENNVLCINEAGCYWLMLCAEDSNGLKKECFLQIFVNKG